jgi:hypothetical protein
VFVIKDELFSQLVLRFLRYLEASHLTSIAVCLVFLGDAEPAPTTITQRPEQPIMLGGVSSQITKYINKVSFLK